MNEFLLVMMQSRHTNPTVNVVFENHNVIHTDWITYTRVRGKGCNVWIPIKLLPSNPKYDEMYPISESEFKFYQRAKR